MESQSDVFHDMYQHGLSIISKYPPSLKLSADVGHHFQNWNAIFHSIGKKLLTLWHA